MKTRAKFYVSGVTLLPGQPGIQVTLNAVCRGDRNAEWAEASPNGSMSMTINNPAAAKQWEDFMQESRRTGKQPEVFIDIFTATDGWAGDGHKFRPSTGKPGSIYGPDRCGECGLAMDAPVYGEYDPETRKSEVIGKAHPNG
jgi:hypothetical protein